MAKEPTDMTDLELAARAASVIGHKTVTHFWTVEGEPAAQPESQPAEEETLVCRKCGYCLEEHWKYCPWCGQGEVHGIEVGVWRP